MAVIRYALVGWVLLAVVPLCLARPDTETIDKAKLVGTWTLVKTDSKNAPPPGAVMTVRFARNGKLIVVASLKEKSFKTPGTYSVKGDQLTTVIKGPDGKSKKETVTIKELTDKKFVTVEKEDGKTVTTEFKK